jgi:antitoxin component YwqK of YwqJK toxin-antitoxin module
VETHGEDEEVDRNFLKDDSNGIDDDLSQFNDGEATADEPQTEVIKERFPDGSVRIERQVTQDAEGNYLNHGPWKMWDEKGNLVAQGEYADGNRTGVWVRWYRNVAEADLLSKTPYQQFLGPFISQATFENGQLDGLWTIYDNRMRKISQWAFAGGKRHGISNWWYANGRKMREVQFREGSVDGQFLEWTPDGAERVNSTYQSGRKLAPKLTYHAGGQKKSEGMYLYARDVEQTPDDWWACTILVTDKSGKDEKHGTFTVWHPNGQRQLEGAYDHEVQVGLFTWWHSNGQEALEGRFDQGKQDGAWTWWHANGQKSIQGQYAQGNPSGRWTWWKEDGKVAQAADMSKLDGLVLETPRALEPTAAPRISKPISQQPVRR